MKELRYRTKDIHWLYVSGNDYEKRLHSLSLISPIPAKQAFRIIKETLKFSPEMPIYELIYCHDGLINIQDNSKKIVWQNKNAVLIQ